jgi:hypothetical protein
MPENRYPIIAPISADVVAASIKLLIASKIIAGTKEMAAANWIDLTPMPFLEIQRSRSIPIIPRGIVAAQMIDTQKV